MQKMTQKILMGLSLTIASSAALAHPGHGLGSAYACFMHPFTGWDHLLVMLAVGLWAGKLGGNMRRQLPATFLGMMAIGAIIGSTLAQMSWLETTVAASVMAMGALLMLSSPLKPALRIALIATFAIFHGMAHGAELQSGWLTMVAMLSATALLHAAGLVLSSSRFTWLQTVHKSLGLIMILLGGYTLIA